MLVGLFGKQINIPAFLAVANEFQFYGSLWGNYNELANMKKIRHHVEIWTEGHKQCYQFTSL